MELVHSERGARCGAQAVQAQQYYAYKALLLQEDQLSEVLIGRQQYGPACEGLGKDGGIWNSRSRFTDRND